jgi:hypothetical protein
VTAGCGANKYCPSQPDERGQMAVFLTKTFSLLLYGPRESSKLAPRPLRN